MNPIETAVLPLKNDAILAAEQYAENLICNIRRELSAADFDAEKVAPFPHSTWSRSRYVTAIAKLDLVMRLTQRDEERTPSCRRPHQPLFVILSNEGIERFIADAKRDAAVQYDAFVAKLVAKVGPVEAASLNGNHVWGLSLLTVTKADGSQETWKTQSILNVSKLGKVFNQWPTRKVWGKKK